MAWRTSDDNDDGVVEIVRISLGWDGCKQARLNFDCPKNEVRNVGFV